MFKEMESFHNIEMWDLVKLPNGINLIGSMWIFKKKLNVAGQGKKFKARMVAKGYYQVEGVKLGDIFSSIAKLTSIRLLMSLVVEFGL